MAFGWPGEVRALGFGVWEMGFEVPSGAGRADWGWWPNPRAEAAREIIRMVFPRRRFYWAGMSKAASKKWKRKWLRR